MVIPTSSAGDVCMTRERKGERGRGGFPFDWGSIRVRLEGSPGVGVKERYRYLEDELSRSFSNEMRWERHGKAWT